ncbi:MAG: TorF family putative porin [Hyphomicrobium sp.]
MATLSKIAGGVVAAGLALSALSGAARAEDKFGYSVSIVGVSDYLFRGQSLTNESPAFQPFVEFTYGMWYLDFWGSNIGEGDTGYGPWELDTYAGVRPVTGPISWDLAVWYYQYGHRDEALSYGDLNYVEFKVSGTVTPVENLSWNVTAYATPSQGIAITDTWTLETTVGYTLPQMGIFVPTVSGGVGYWGSDTDSYFLGKEKGYTYWNAGVKLGVDKFFMDLRYWDTSIDDDLADSRFLFSAGVNLP